MDIRVEAIDKSFDGRKVLDHFSCRFIEGQTTCIMGESGCGKTTLLRILLGLETADAGTVSEIPKDRISAVFQENRLCENLSAAANIRLVCREHLSEDMINAAFGAVCLNDVSQKPVRLLSGGMKRRVSILRALIAKADYIFMDEPLKGLDTHTKLQTAAYIREKTKGKTLIVVTHDTADIELLKAAHVVRMTEGVFHDTKDNRAF
ncbi:MAG: ATP-binding cassette domain-containing protein [Clostridiales bacterium]|nr:ATP-binding cassette domain-containing protein [Clostridiales bacterium]MDY3746035.1 ATP-binding cassette domain-containing protein [Lachnospiraceae bacterium]